ncbi:MAG: hypothetical protein Q4D23_01630 [Bacteroidales bacterium]|nr:hypothetical protein [Bacteroidales bacterium]
MNDLQFEPADGFVMEPGKEYPGYGMINRYGEMHFRPRTKRENTADPTAETLYRSDGVTICESKNTFMLHVTLPKTGLSFTTITNRLLAAATRLTPYLKIKRNQ